MSVPPSSPFSGESAYGGASLRPGEVVIRRNYSPADLPPVRSGGFRGESARSWAKPFFFVGLLAWGVNSWWDSRPVRHEPAMLVPTAPIQGGIPVDLKPWEFKNCTVRPMASYDITARVLHRERYRFDGMSDISPLDLGVGWLMMSDQRYVDAIQFTNSARFLRFSSADADLPWSVIQSCAANTHIIPANDDVRDKLLALREGQIFRATGYLVEVDRPGMEPWRSSLSREDSGDGACEIMWVEWVNPKP